MEVVKGRKRRVRKLGIVEAMMRARTERMRVVRGFSLRDVGPFRWNLIEMIKVLEVFMYGCISLVDVNSR